MCTLMCIVEILHGRVYTGRIGSRQQLAGGVPWVCSRGAQRSYGDHLHPIRLRFHGKPLFWKIGRFFLRHEDMWWFCPTWPKCAFGDQKGLIQNKDIPFGNPPHHGTKHCGLLKNTDFFIFLPFMGQEVVFWVKKTVVFECLDRVWGSRPEPRTKHNQNEP